MKMLVANLLKSTLVVIVLFVSSNIYASGDIKVAPIEGSKKAKIYIAPDNNTNLQVSILDKNESTLLYSENIPNKEAYNKVYNFNQLEEGLYKIVAESENKIVETNIIVASEGVSVISEIKIYKPYFDLKDGKLTVNYFNNDEKDINVYFSDYKNVFFKDTKANDLLYSKKYNLAELEKGNYVVSLNSGNQTYNYYFEVQ